MAREDVQVEPVPEDLGGIRGWLQKFRADFDSHNHDGANSRRFQTVKAETVQARAFSVRKSSFTDNTSGFWAGLVGNTMKMFLGSASAYLKWTGTALQIAGDIVAGSITIGTNAIIDSNGNATFFSMSSLNKKAFTNFETAGRFIGSTGGTGSNTFGNQGVTIACGATGTSYARLLWDIAGVFRGIPTFTATLNMFSVGSGDARSFVGMGLPNIDGSGITYSGRTQVGFRIDKTSGVVTLSSEMNDGGSGTSVGTNITTVAEGDIIELYIKMTTTQVKWYYRKNSGDVTLGDTQTTHIPSDSTQYLFFGVSNTGSANDFKIIMQCAAYEH